MSASDYFIFWTGLLFLMGALFGGVITYTNYEEKISIANLQLKPCLEHGYTETHCIVELKKQIGMENKNE